ncbi:uncharacterized protein LOC135168395 [Diachasmimorpha longicaudata]|uniref:uncharacterized protein LOC135168395 n=1 Tax=Diachasmimorpha longicaudata TaxID=58733 RepID=UPI0030B8BFDD
MLVPYEDIRMIKHLKTERKNSNSNDRYWLRRRHLSAARKTFLQRMLLPSVALVLISCTQRRPKKSSRMSVHEKLIAATIIAIIAINNVKSECVESKPCLCVRADGMGLSLAALAAIGPLKNDNGSVGFQPCKNMNFTFPHSVAPQPPDPAYDCHNTSLCWLNNENKSVNLGSLEETHWHWTEKNPELVISHGSYESHIELICANRGNSPILTGPSATKTLLKFQLSSDKLCITDMRPKSLSTGSVLVILFFVFAGVYFIGGALILIYCRGAVGREIIPNYDFWADLPALVRDGVTFTLSGCSAVSYERI